MHTRIVIACGALASFTLAIRAEEPKETKLKPTVMLSGTHSAIRQERFEVITTQRKWEQLWKRHRGERVPHFNESSQELSIDFQTHYVVAVFTGWSAWCGVTPRQRGDTILIGYRASIWQTEGRQPKQTAQEKAREDALAPYSFVVLPKPVKAVIIEEDVRRSLPDPPLWEERARFPVPSAKK